MRAPPEHETIIIGRRVASARSMPLRDFLANDDAHASADESVLHRCDDGFVAVDAAARHDNRVFQARGFHAGFQPCLVGLRIGEPERIGGYQAAIVFCPRAVEQRPETVERVHAEVMAALRADAHVLPEILVVEDLRAPGALDPEAFGHPARLCRLGGNSLARLLEPGHMWRLYLNPVRGT